jgi:hypothetical protein
VNIEEAVQAAAALASNELKHHRELVMLFAGVSPVMDRLPIILTPVRPAG